MTSPSHITLDDMKLSKTSARAMLKANSLKLKAAGPLAMLKTEWLKLISAKSKEISANKS